MKLPQFKPRDLMSLIGRAGFVRTHDKGGHAYFRHANGRTTCVPQHPGDMPPGLVRKILFKDAGLSEQQVRNLL